MNLKTKIDELARKRATVPGTTLVNLSLESEFKWCFKSSAGQELLRWVATQAVENAESNLNWSCNFGCERSEFCDKWWAEFSGEGR